MGNWRFPLSIKIVLGCIFKFYLREVWNGPLHQYLFHHILIYLKNTILSLELISFEDNINEYNPNSFINIVSGWILFVNDPWNRAHLTFISLYDNLSLKSTCLKNIVHILNVKYENRKFYIILNIFKICRFFIYVIKIYFSFKFYFIIYYKIEILNAINFTIFKIKFHYKRWGKEFSPSILK